LSSKGFTISVHKTATTDGLIVVVRDKKGATVKQMPLSEWSSNEKEYSSIYGQLPPPPPPPPSAPNAPGKPVPAIPAHNAPQTDLPVPAAPPVPPTPPTFSGVAIPEVAVTSADGKQMTFSSAIAPEGSFNPIRIKSTNEKEMETVLYILDGKRIKYTEVNSINPNDIQKINVLKGESAKTIYGDDGKNGAIIIETKKKAASSFNQPRIGEQLLLKKEKGADDGC
jgi:TonB-dependent SusC/RagA subfamily outer membrane receptor